MKDWIPYIPELIISLLVLVVVVFLLLRYRKVINNRLEKGAAFKLGPIQIGKDPSSASVPQPDIQAPKVDVNKHRMIASEIIKNRLEKSLKNAVVDHEKVFGITEKLDEVNQFLSNTSGDWCISLFGDGGIGKTTFAYELVKNYGVADSFSRFAWVSAKRMFFGVGTTTDDPLRNLVPWTDLIKEIANQLEIDIGYSRTDWIEDFRKNIAYLPEYEKCLIVIDNLETTDDTSLATYFYDQKDRRKYIFQPHKVIFTSRKAIKGILPNIIEKTIDNLSPKSALDFIRYLGRSNEEIQNASDEEIESITIICEGNPFLIKLVVQRYLELRKPLKLILNELKNSHSQFGNKVFDYLYLQSLQVLDSEVGVENRKRLMAAFCPRPAGDLFTYEQLFQSSHIDKLDTFEKTRTLACRLSLVRASGTASNMKYSIHSLLHQYICEEE